MTATEHHPASAGTVEPGPASSGAPQLVLVDAAPTENSLVESDLLVEDVSIDGMCGVY